MATACGPEGPIGPSPIAIGDERSTFQSPGYDSLEAPSPSLEFAKDGPPPNPPFSFPTLPSPSSAPPSFSRATGRRPQSAIESPSPRFDMADDDFGRGDGRMALPAFSFNPGASLPTESLSPMLLSPPISPNAPKMGASAQRPGGHGHRRGGSEFVGGRIRDGNSIAVLGTSPTKSESGFSSPTFQPPRRGHRRGVSSHISSNDIPIMPASVVNSLLKGSSAPTSPTDMQHPPFASFPVSSDAPSKSSTEPATPTADTESDAVDNSQATTPTAADTSKPASRARVGFSDTLEFIPRPLSLVSSDTSSTMTARPGHSVSGSMSSLISLSSPYEMPTRTGLSPLSRSPSREAGESRPSTAGAILEHSMEEAPPPEIPTSPRRRNSIPALMDIASPSDDTALATPSPSKTPKRWSFFGLDAFASSNSPTKVRRHSASSEDSMSRAVSAGSSSEHGSESVGEGSESTGGKSGKNRTAEKHSEKKKKKKRAKAWAGSILPRKSKSHSKRGKIMDRPPTPPAAQPVFDDDDDDQEPAITQPLVSPPPPTVTITESRPLSRGNGPSKRSFDEPSTPMIDLDAALGPFNTPIPSNPEWDAAQRAAGGLGKRRLHSAQGLKGFTGPGMHYHRRAESAPDLPPFDPGRQGIHRFGSSSTMADVFEEDEEDDGTGKHQARSIDAQSEVAVESDGEMTPPAITVGDEPIEQQEPASLPMIRRKSSGVSEKDYSSSTPSVRAERSRTSLHDNVIIEDTPSIIFRSANVFQCRPESSHSAATSYRKGSGGKELSPVDVGPLHTSHSNTVPISPYSTSLASSYPSPRSPMSVDAQRISTAPSSLHDENNFHSLLLGEPGPEVRISMDYDIPSLTSSTSTMTRESAYVGPSPRLPTPASRDAARPSSMGSAAFGRRRSSLVSLSRLISSAHGERSKLSMEVTMDNDVDRKKSKTSKSRRLGRLMSFWKPNNKEDGVQT